MLIAQPLRLAHPSMHAGMTNKQRLARYDLLIERAQERAERAASLETRRRYLHLMLRLQQRALHEVSRVR